jgi:hypothetical protein
MVYWVMMPFPASVSYPPSAVPQNLELPVPRYSRPQNIASIGVKATTQKPMAKLQNRKIAKLQNKSLGRDLSLSSSADSASSTEDYEAVATAISKSERCRSLAARKNEQLLRLALAALGDPSRHYDIAMDGDLSSSSLITRTTSYMSTMVSTLSSIDEDSVLEDSPSVLSALPQTPCPGAEVQRIGVDIGGVLVDIHKITNKIREVKGGADAVRTLMKTFGEKNVFLVSKVRLGGQMHRRTQRWLQGPTGLFARTGLPAENIVFVEHISGSLGKGVAAKTLGLSHFVDDKWEVLQAVVGDKAGNSGNLVQRFEGILFHFAKGGSGRWRPEPPAALSVELKGHYYAVSGWLDVLHRLSNCPSSKVMSDKEALTPQRKTNNLVKEVLVGVDDDPDFGVVKRVLGHDDEHFKYIATECSVKVILYGHGSPHPTPPSLQDAPLRVSILAQKQDRLDLAVVLVEDLIQDILEEHQAYIRRS